MRLMPASSAASEKLSKERVTPGNPTELLVILTLLPKKEVIGVALAVDGHEPGIESKSGLVSIAYTTWSSDIPPLPE